MKRALCNRGMIAVHAAGALLVSTFIAAGPLHGQSCTTTRVSVSSQGGEAHGSSSVYASISADGRYVLFSSHAPDLVPGDTNGVRDIFVRDRVRGTTVRVNVSTTGLQANAQAWYPAMSADGRFVSFRSKATNLVRDKVVPGLVIFIHDRELGTTERLQIPHTQETYGMTDGGQAMLSAEGRYVVFTSPSQALVAGPPPMPPAMVYLHDRWTGSTEIASVNSRGEYANMGTQYYPVISADGRSVAFSTRADNLVPGDTNGHFDVFVHDRWAGTTERVSVSSSGQQGNEFCQVTSISPDGRFVGFYSSATNLVPGDTNGFFDCFVHDRATGQTERVSVGPGGVQGDGDSMAPLLNADGRYVAFGSHATNLVPGDTNGVADIFVRDRELGVTERASVAWDGSQANAESENGLAISWDGKRVAFGSSAWNLVPGDSGWWADVFVRDCGWPLPASYCTSKANSAGCLPTMDAQGMPSASAGGGFEVSAGDVLNQTAGLLFYSTSGALAMPFQGGWLCVQPPLGRTPVQHSGGSSGPPADCSGSFALDFNRWISLGPDPALVPGQVVWTQYYARDPGFPSASAVQLTNALRFEIQP